MSDRDKLANTKDSSYGKLDLPFASFDDGVLRLEFGSESLSAYAKKILDMLAIKGAKSKWDLKKELNLDYSLVHKCIFAFRVMGLVKLTGSTISQHNKQRIGLYGLTKAGCINWLSYAPRSTTEINEMVKHNSDSSVIFREWDYILSISEQAPQVLCEAAKEAGCGLFSETEKLTGPLKERDYPRKSDNFETYVVTGLFLDHWTIVDRTAIWFAKAKGGDELLHDPILWMLKMTQNDTLRPLLLESVEADYKLIMKVAAILEVVLKQCHHEKNNVEHKEGHIDERQPTSTSQKKLDKI
ncbi:MAG: hypothetical protein HYY22_09120 [Thaumarchaeota archaeon]|nr:hypothetical protein [Nitrososphaerota archaeon]